LQLSLELAHRLFKLLQLALEVGHLLFDGLNSFGVDYNVSCPFKWIWGLPEMLNALAGDGAVTITRDSRLPYAERDALLESFLVCHPLMPAAITASWSMALDSLVVIACSGEYHKIACDSRNGGVWQPGRDKHEPGLRLLQNR
jgi:hypothetical protein